MKLSHLILIPCMFTLVACGETRNERAASGALIGAGTGAAAGALIAGNPWAGAAVGGAIGAGAGAAVGALSDHPVWH